MYSRGGSMLRQKGGIQLKKQAYHHLLRKQHLHNYFSHIRQQLVHQINKVPYHPLQDQADQLILQLPEKAYALLDLLNEEVKVLGPYLAGRVREMTGGMVDMQLGEWSAIVTIINKLLVSLKDTQMIEQIISNSLAPVLDYALILASKQNSHIPHRSILVTTLHYCFRLGTFLKRINLIEINSLTAALTMLWREEWDEDEETMLVATVYNILSVRFDEDEEENVGPVEERDLGFMKSRVVGELFERGERKEMRKLVSRTAELALQEKQSELLTGYLRLLIQLTLLTEQVTFYYSLLSNHILMAINSICLLGEHPPIAVILALRLLNNILVNDFTLTTGILKQIMLFKLFALPSKYPDYPQIKVELAELLINLMHFMNDDAELIRQLADNGVGSLIVGCLELEKEQLKEDYVEWVMCGITIIRDHHPQSAKKLILQEEGTLKATIEKFPYCGAMVQDLLASVRPPGQLLSEL